MAISVTTVIDPVGVRLALIPAGEFQMGTSTDEAARFRLTERYRNRESPQRVVAIDAPFAVATVPVTRGDFSRFVEATGKEPAHWCEVFRDGKWLPDPKLSWRNPGYEQADDHPVVSISWSNAHDYLDWLSSQGGHRYRLLSDAEFEYATRAGTTTPWYWGDDEGAQGLYANGADQSSLKDPDVFSLSQTYGSAVRPAASDSGFVHTSPVGQLRPNAFGLHDMLGNVWEWVEDCFDEAVLPQTQKPNSWAKAQFRTIRGGSWLMEPAFMRSASRQRDHFWHNDRDIGFRVARDLTPDEVALVTS